MLEEERPVLLEEVGRLVSCSCMPWFNCGLIVMRLWTSKSGDLSEAVMVHCAAAELLFS